MEFFDLKFKKNDKFYDIKPHLFDDIFELFEAVEEGESVEDKKTALLYTLIKRTLREIAESMQPKRINGYFVTEEKNAHRWTFSGDNEKHIDRLRKSLNTMYPIWDIEIIIEENTIYRNSKNVSSRFD